MSFNHHRPKNKPFVFTEELLRNLRKEIAEELSSLCVYPKIKIGKFRVICARCGNISKVNFDFSYCMECSYEFDEDSDSFETTGDA